MTSPSYNPVTEAIADELRAIVGESYVVFDDPERLEPYSHDEVPDPAYRHMPEALVRPRTAEEISAVLKVANRERIPVTHRGAPAAGSPAGPSPAEAASSCSATA